MIEIVFNDVYPIHSIKSFSVHEQVEVGVVRRLVLVSGGMELNHRLTCRQVRSNFDLPPAGTPYCHRVQRELLMPP